MEDTMKYVMKLETFFIFISLIPAQLFGQLSGQYTIGPSGNYPNFKAAASALTTQGVSGAVTFLAEPGTYDEHISLGAINGASAENTITFQGTSTAQCTLTYNATEADSNYIVQLTNSQYIRFRDLTFVAQHPTYGRIFYLLQGVNDLELTDNILQGVLASGAEVNRAIFYSDQQWPDNIRISGNAFYLGGYGIHLGGRSDHAISGVEIFNNTFTDGGYRSISVTYAGAPQIYNNTVSNSSDGIYLHTVLGNTQIYNNRLNVGHYGMNLYLQGYTTDRAKIYNNFVTSSGPAGIRMQYNSYYYDICYNSINIVPVNATSASPIMTNSALSIDQGVSIYIRNNNLANQAGGYAYFNTATLPTYDSDYNNLYSPGNSLAYYNGKCPDLKAFQDSTGQDLHSLSVYPHYASNSDLHSIAPWLDEKASPLADINVDIDGETRDPSQPDIGADEFTPATGTKIPLSGSKIVGTGGDYSTLNEAVMDLELKGISAPVTFNILPDSLIEQIRMVSVPGASYQNRITFQSSTGNAGDVIIAFAAPSAEENYVWKFFGASRITLRNLTLRALDSYNARVLELWGRSDSLIIKNNIFHGSTATDAQQRKALIYASQSDYRGRIIHNNSFYNCAFGIWLYNSGAGFLGDQLEISENYMNNDGYCGIYLGSHHSIDIEKNNIRVGSYGITIISMDGILSISKNRINATSYGIEINSCTDSESRYGLIANNTVTLRQANRGLGIHGCGYQKILFNSFYLLDGNYNSSVFLVDGSSQHLTVLNNSFAQKDAAQVYSVTTTNAFDQLDYNNLYTPGNDIVIWGSSRIMHLKEFQTQTGYDQNSVEVYPHYLSETDLHTVAPWLNNKGLSSPTEVTDDMDGEPRDINSPDIGADEFSPAPSSLNKMQGEYLVGTIYYPTIQSLLDAAELRGVSDTLIFSILPGTYQEQLDILSIPGASSLKPVIFRSQSGNVADVEIQYSATSQDSNYVIRVYGADFLMFKDLTVSATGNQYARVFDLYKGSDSLVIQNNNLNSVAASGNDGNKMVIYSKESLYRSRIIQDNTLNGGAFSIFLSRDYPNIGHPTGLKIFNNTISNNGYTGLYLYYQDGMEIVGNQINTDYVGMLALSCDSAIVIEKNQLDVTYDHGFRISACSASPANPGLIANNFIHIGGGSSGTGLSVSTCNNQNIYYNSINVTSTSPTNGIALYTNAGSGLNIIDNILTNNGGGIAYDAYNFAGINLSDYNDIFTTGPVLARWNGNQANLATLQAASGMDAHSISVDPAFTSSTNLHTNLPALDASGTPLASVNDDIDGQPRHPVTPDIGADEFMLGSNNPPILANPISDVVYDEDTGPHQVVADLNTVFSDPDAGDFLTFSTQSQNPDIQAYLQSRVTLLVNSTLNYSGIGEVIITATDFGSLSVSDTFMVTINPENDPPLAVDDQYVILISTSTLLNVLANDNDPDHDPLTISGFSSPSHGSVVIDPGDTTLTYTPLTGYSGTDTFNYIISDGHGAQDTATVSLSIETPFTTLTYAFENVSHSSLAWGDFDSDGNLDVLLTGLRSGSDDFVTQIYRNNISTSGNFSLHQNLTGVMPINPRGASWCDFDNDGDPDIIVTGEENGNPTTNLTKLYRNINGIFSEVTTGLPGVWAGSVDWGDFDNDGDQDLLLTGNLGVGNYVTDIYRNDGSASGSSWTFTPLNAALLQVWQGAAIWVDYDKDRDLDILLYGVSSLGGDTTLIYRNDQGSFTDIQAGLKGIFNGDAAWGDYDSDGDLDLLIAGDTGLFEPITKIYRQDNNNIFTDILAPISGVRSSTVGWGDHNNDGELDLFVAGLDTAGLPITQIYTNENMQFTGTHLDLTGYSYASAAWGDYDNDSDLDILISGLQNDDNRYTQILRNNTNQINTPPDRPHISGWSINQTNLGLFWYPGYDNQTLRPGLNYNLRIGTTPGGAEILSPMALPDGQRKVASLGNVQSDTSWIVYNLIPGAYYYVSLQALDNSFAGSEFSVERKIMTASFYFSRTENDLPGVLDGASVWGDYDNDGDLDLAISGYHDPGTYVGAIYRNDDSVFVNINANLPGLSSSAMAWGDYDNDNDLDLVLTGQIPGAGYGKIFRNDNGTFTDIQAEIAPSYSGSVAWGDYDNDGDLDLLQTGWGYFYGNPMTRLYRNDQGIFHNVPTNLPNVWTGTAIWGDYDRDGDMDILITGWAYSGYITKIFQNDNGIFTENANAVLPQVRNSSAAWGDYDCDGYPDIVLSGLELNPVGVDTAITRVYHNDHNGQFTDIQADIEDVQAGALTWGDIDNNGYLDIIQSGGTDPSNSTPATRLYRYVSGNFEPVLVYLTDVTASSVDLGDYDADGKLDFILTGKNGENQPITEIYHNTNQNVNTVPQTPTGLSSQVQDGIVTLNWQPSSDQQTPQTGLSYNLRIGTSPGGSQILSAMADGAGLRKFAKQGNTDHLTSGVIKNPLPAEKYYWSVQAIDNAFAGSAFAVEDSFSIGIFSQNFYHSGINQYIDDFQFAADTIYAVFTGKILSHYQLIDVQVLVDSVLHSSVSNLEFTLIHETTEDTIIYRVGGDGDNFIHTLLTDSASTPIASGTAPFTGTFQPYQPLSQFASMDPAGQWILKVYDNASGNTGTLNAWGLTLVFEMVTGIDNPLSGIPIQYQLYQNYPNPFNPVTNIKFDLPQDSKVKIIIFNLLGQKIATLFDNKLPAGRYHYQWKPDGIASGIYFYSIEAERYRKVRKMIFMK